MIKFAMVLLPFLLSSAGVLAQHRKLTLEVNPGCGDKCKDRSGALIHVAAIGPNDTLHHVWDFFGKPTVFLALTPPNTNLTIDWDAYLSHQGKSWDFTNSTDYVFALVINKIIEFEDLNGTAVYDPTAHINKTVIPTDSCEWSLVDESRESDEHTASLKGTFPKDTNNTGNILIKLSAFADAQHSNVTPHLFHTMNSTQVDFVFNNLTSYFNTSHSRYALDLAVFHTNSNHSILPVNKKKLDDEHSPGVFTITDLVTADKDGRNGYLQWKDVAYWSPARIMTNSTIVHLPPANPPILNASESFVKSGVFAYFGEALDDVPANSVIVSFGTEDDGYYGGTNYITWTFLAGIGVPGDDSFSLMVLLILGLGLGIPSVLVVITTGCIISRRINRTRDQLLAGH
uniref:Lysosomal protein NCU-G1-B n=1 Tax=Lygus hesperus TaxID=30085 RepID=A0A0A9Y2B9_LYGHE